MTLVREFNLYLTAGRTIPLVINVNQFDSGEEWHFTLFKEDGTQYIPSTGAIVGIKSDGLGIINSGTVVDGKVVINETQQMTAAVGKATFELTIDSGTHGTANFHVLVEPKPGNNADLSDSDLSLIQEALNAVSPLPTGGTVGQVLTKTAQGSAWSDAGTPTQEQVAEAVSDWADEHITVETGVVIDTSLSVAGAAADAKKTGDEISDLKSTIDNLEAIPYEVKQAIDNIFTKSVYVADDVASDYATFHAWASSVNVTSISAVYTQSGTVYDSDSLDDLKADLVVTASYNNGTSAVVSGYTLSGTLTEGTSTITVTYGGKSTTFNVTVTPCLYYWDLTKSLTDTKQGAVITTANNGVANALSVGSGGVELISQSSALLLPTGTYGLNRRIEVDIASGGTWRVDERQSPQNGAIIGVCTLISSTITANPDVATIVNLLWRGTESEFEVYAHSAWHDIIESPYNTPINRFDGKTLFMESDSSGYISFGYIENGADIIIGTLDIAHLPSTSSAIILGRGCTYDSGGAYAQGMKGWTVKAIKIIEKQ